MIFMYIAHAVIPTIAKTFFPSKVSYVLEW